MRSPFVDSASFLSQPPRSFQKRESVLVGRRLLMLALVMAVAASSAVLLAI